MSLYESVVRPLAFLLDPETAHNLGLSLIARGLVSSRTVDDPRLRRRLLGLDFANPLGLAAGFDKSGIAVRRWHRLGFGFAEIGTITFHPQPGNPGPRLFRLPRHKALINRMGFNNEGAESVAGRLAQATPKLPIGINLGKSKITDLERAPEDYRESFKLLRSFGAYFVVNVSSPNTPGLRSLQERGPLTDIIGAIQSVDPAVRLFVKIAPDLELSALDEVVAAAHETKLAGLIATNTTISRDGIDGSNAGESGGMSGAPLRERSDQFLAHLARSRDPGMLLIGVGGIFTGDDLYHKISLGADLCQIYTGWVYRGPTAVSRILAEFLLRLDREGVASLDALRGSALRASSQTTR